MSREVLSYQFDDVVIDLRAGRVLRAGTATPLEPKAYDLLVLLASRSGELVTRQEVLDRVWAGVYVTDNAVARVIAQVRRVLGDSARASRYIETVPTRGYRFIVPVTLRFAATSSASPATLVPAAATGAIAGQGGPGPGSTGAPQVRAATSAAAAQPDDTRNPAYALQVSARQAGHPLWAAGLALVALMAILLAWRSQTTSSRESAGLRVGTRTQITSSAVLDAFPAWSPDGRTLAYASDRGGRFEIFIRDMTAGGDRIALTADRQHNVQPAWSPDGSRLAYHSSGRGGIWVIARSGGTPFQISRFGSRPSWSPDGTRVAFQGAPYTEPGAAAFETFGPSSLWVVTVDGSEPRMATRGWRPEGSHVRPTWFPDGQRLFFCKSTARHDRLVDRRSRVWCVDPRPRGSRPGRRRHADAGRSRRVLRPHGRSLRLVEAAAPRGRHGRCRAGTGLAAGRTRHPTRRDAPAWQPVGLRRDGDGRRPAQPAASQGRDPRGSVRAYRGGRRAASATPLVQSGRPSCRVRATGGRGPPGLWLLDLAQGSVRALAVGLTDARDPAWSRDGTRVYFETGEDTDVVLQAMRVQDGGTEIVARLADGAHTLLRPRVSPDGTRLAYTRSSEGQLEVWVRALADGTDTRVARLGDGVAFPAWSPDGQAVAVDVWRDGHAQVYVADLASGVITQVSREVDQAWVRSWSPDGTRLAFAGATDGRWNVWSVRRDGTDLRQLTDYGDEHHYVRNPEWSPTGDRLVYEFATFSGNIWAVPLP